MEIRKELLNHFKKVQEGLRQVNGEAFLSMETFIVEVRLGDRLYKLYPHFVVPTNGATAYTPTFFLHVIRFAGWRAHFYVTPFSFARKLKFKELLLQHKFTTPDYSTAIDSPLRDVIVKKDISSFGTKIKGPFRSASDCMINVQEGEFYEKFIPGQIIKIWFWNHRPVCLEIKDMPIVVGDGHSTISDLIEKKPTRSGNKPNLKIVAETLAFYRKDLTTVLQKGQPQIINFRYTADFGLFEETEEINLSTTKDPRFNDELWQLGKILWDVLYREGYNNVAFTVDAMLDANNKLWFLEANPNPFIHPAIYPAMIKGLADSIGSQENNVRHLAHAPLKELRG